MLRPQVVARSRVAASRARPSRTATWLTACAAVAACGDGKPPAPDAATEREVLVLRAVPNHQLDLLFVIDDSQSLDLQVNLKAKIGVLHDMFSRLDPPEYDLHVGVLSTDMGTTTSLDRASPAPGIGNGPGSCSGVGKDGRLQKYSSTPVSDVFLAEQRSEDGTLTTNYTTTFDAVLGSMMSLGASGCGFEQPLASLKRSFEQPANDGFYRDSANLAVVLFLEEDDCSVRDPVFFSDDTNLLGYRQSFRCTRWGLQCNEDVNIVGDKTGCHPWPDSPYVDDIAPYRDALLALKPDPRMLAVTGIIGNPEPVIVEARTPPGGGSAIPALKHSCTYQGANGPEVADPGKRLEYFLDSFPPETSTTLTSICTQDLTDQLQRVGAAIKKTLGDTCIDTRSLLDTDEARDGVQPSCSVEDVRDSDPTPVTVPFELVEDAQMCPFFPEHLRLVLHRTGEPAPDAWTHVRCKLAL